MKHALARGLSYEEHLRTISAREMAEWEALNTIEPLFDRADYHTAEICTVIAGIVSKKTPQFERFLMFHVPEKKPAQSMDEMKAIAKQLHNLFKGRG